MDRSSKFTGLFLLIVIGILLFWGRTLFPNLSTIVFIGAGIALVLLIMLVIFVVVLAFHKTDRKIGSRVDTPTELISKGRSSIVQMRQQVLRLQNREIRTRAGVVLDACEKILWALKDQPGDVSRVRQFFTYYLPTLSSILKKYAFLESSGVMEPSTPEKVLSCLDNIQSAMDKMYAGLFDNDALDLTVEMDVLMQICKRDGLLAEETLPAGH